MMNFIKNEIVKLTTGETCKIINIPGTFMSNGAYEIMEVEITFGGSVIEPKEKKTKWVKPELISYSMSRGGDTKKEININKYFEIIPDEEIQIIPKGLMNVEFVTDGNGFNTVKLIYEDKTVNLLIGDFKLDKNIEDENKERKN